MVAQIRPQMGAVTPLKGDDPSRYVRESRDRQRAGAEFAQAANTGMQYFKELEQDEASTNTSLKYSEWWNEATANPVLSSEDARNMGYDGPALSGADMEDRDDIDLWEVLPELSKRKYDELIEEQGSTISGFGARQKWKNDRKVAGQDIYNDMLASQREEMFKRRVTKHEESIEQAKLVGDYNLAMTLANTHPIPSRREEMLQETQKRGATDGLHGALQSKNPDTMLEQAKWINEGGMDGILTEAEQTAWIDQLENSAQRYAAEGATTRSLEWDVKRANLEVKIAAGEAGPVELMELAEQAYERNDPLPEGWLGSQMKIADEANRKRLEREMYGNNAILASSGMSVTDPTNPKAVDGVNYAAEQIVDNPATDYQTKQDQLINLAAGNNVMPDIMAQQLRTIANPKIGPRAAMDAAFLYNRLSTEAPNTLKDVPAEAKLLLETMWLYSRGGSLTEDSIREAHESINSSEPDLIEARRNKVTISKTNGEMLASFNDNFLKDSKFQTFAQQWIPFTEDSMASDRMYLDYQARVEYNTILGAPPEVASAAAYREISASYGISNMNGGPPEIMKDSPEQVYGLSTEVLLEDRNAWLDREFPGVNKDNIIIKPHKSTRFQKTPRYQVYMVDEDTGMFQFQRDQNKVPVTWAPNYKRLSEEARQKVITQAENERNRYKEFGIQVEAQNKLPAVLPQGDPIATNPNLINDMGMNQ